MTYAMAFLMCLSGMVWAPSYAPKYSACFPFAEMNGECVTFTTEGSVLPCLSATGIIAWGRTLKEDTP